MNPLAHNSELSVSARVQLDLVTHSLKQQSSLLRLRYRFRYRYLDQKWAEITLARLISSHMPPNAVHGSGSGGGGGGGG